MQRDVTPCGKLQSPLRYRDVPAETETLMRPILLLAALSLFCLALPARAATVPTQDVAGSHDHPVVSRYAGSVIAGWQQLDYDETVFPLGKASWKVADHFTSIEQVKGRTTRIFYVVPAGKTGVEVFANFRSALDNAGFHIQFECSGDDGAHGCGGMDFANYVATPLYDTLKARNLMVETLNAVDGNVRSLTAHLDRAEGNVDVSLVVSQNQRHPVGVLLQVVEASAMETGKVTVDAKAMGQGLAQVGHIALYGIRFASDSAEFEADSDDTLAQMAELLQSQPTLKVYIVGHTDSTGTLAHNLALSQQRAEAVVNRLSGKYGIAPSRLAAKGMASYAPVASNRDTAGRAKNRRVEMVEQ